MQSYVVEEFYRSVCKSRTRASELTRGTLKGYTYFYTRIYYVNGRLAGLVSLYTKGLLVPVCTSYLFITQSIIIHVDLRTKRTLLSR